MRMPGFFAIWVVHRSGTDRAPNQEFRSPYGTSPPEFPKSSTVGTQFPMDPWTQVGSQAGQKEGVMTGFMLPTRTEVAPIISVASIGTGVLVSVMNLAWAYLYLLAVPGSIPSPLPYPHICRSSRSDRWCPHRCNPVRRRAPLSMHKEQSWHARSTSMATSFGITKWKGAVSIHIPTRICSSTEISHGITMQTQHLLSANRTNRTKSQQAKNRTRTANFHLVCCTTCTANFNLACCTTCMPALPTKLQYLRCFEYPDALKPGSMLQNWRHAQLCCDVSHAGCCFKKIPFSIWLPNALDPVNVRSRAV